MRIIGVAKISFNKACLSYSQLNLQQCSLVPFRICSAAAVTLSLVAVFCLAEVSMLCIVFETIPAPNVNSDKMKMSGDRPVVSCRLFVAAVLIGF